MTAIYENAILVLIITAIITFIFVKTQNFHKSITLDNYTGPQKIHLEETTRIGGLALFFSYIIIYFFLPDQISKIMFVFLFSSIAAFFSGLLEDLTKKIKPLYRLLGSFLTGFTFLIIIDIRINNIDIELLSFLFQNQIFSFIFTLLCIALLVQSTNIIDGLNGLAIGYAILVVVSIFLVSIKIEDEILKSLMIILLAGLVGIFIFNFPKPYIFLGDGGAYLIGAFLSFSIIFFAVRNENISPFYCSLLVLYPIYETIRSFFRRFFVSKSKSFSPDQMHLHSLIYKYLDVRLMTLNANSFASFSILSSQILLFTFGFYFFDNKWVLIIISLFFILFYELVYFKLSKILNFNINYNIRRDSE